MQTIFPEEYSFYPKSWYDRTIYFLEEALKLVIPRKFLNCRFLPAHLDQFRAYCEEDERKREEENSDKKGWYIVKPDEGIHIIISPHSSRFLGAQGTGIYLINNPSQLKNEQQRMLVQVGHNWGGIMGSFYVRGEILREKIVFQLFRSNQLINNPISSQEYVADPFLMADQLKFDFRVYGVIKSLNPLSIYVAREGSMEWRNEIFMKNFRNGSILHWEIRSSNIIQFRKSLFSFDELFVE